MDFRLVFGGMKILIVHLKEVMKYRILLAVFLLGSVAAFAQNSRPDQTKKDAKNERNKEATKLIEAVVGMWQLQETIDKNQKKGQLSKDTLGLAWIEFKPDGKYRSGSNGKAGSVQPLDSGSYRLNEQQGILYLEASADNDAVSHPPAEWSISVKKNIMTLEGKGSMHAQRYRYVYIKTKEGLSTVKQ